MTRPQYSFERTAEIESTLTAAERERARDVRSKIQLGLARCYPALPEPLVNSITRDCLSDKQLYLNVVGAGGPTSQAEFDEISRELVLGNELAVRAINLANDSAVDAARSAALQTISRARRIAMKRDGSLDDYLDSVARQTVLTDAQREQVAL